MAKHTTESTPFEAGSTNARASRHPASSAGGVDVPQTPQRDAKDAANQKVETGPAAEPDAGAPTARVPAAPVKAAAAKKATAAKAQRGKRK